MFSGACSGVQGKHPHCSEVGSVADVRHMVINSRWSIRGCIFIGRLTRRRVGGWLKKIRVDKNGSIFIKLEAVTKVFAIHKACSD